VDDENPAPGWLTRFALLRGLGLIYLVAFLSLATQLLPLLGAHGLLPAATYLDRVREAGRSVPTLFLLDCSDTTLTVCAWVGVALSLLVLFGLANMPMLATLWFLYLSFVNVGQVWYGYGWEILLLEAGFLAIWLVPLWDVRPFPSLPTPMPVVWLFRWLAFRLMWGAGLIKVRGDTCWRDLTCLDTHFETQPLPNPLSPFFHALPHGIHAAMVGWNHVVELLVPFLFFGPRWLRPWAALVTIHFQLTLILSGNLAFLNWLTIVVCFALFDDDHLARVFRPLARRVRAVGVTPPMRRGITIAVTLVVATLSVQPVLNMLSPAQAMNRSFGAWHLVNTYGAFGSVGAERNEVIVQGSDDGVTWVDYEFPCKPGDVMRRPCFVAPFQPRLDWQIWFAAMEEPSENLWLVHLLDAIVRGDPMGTALLAGNPFPAAPPRYIRAELYRYRFARAGEPGWWVRTDVGPYVRAFERGDPVIRDIGEQLGW
jgi:hypothetical protein